MWHWLQRLLRGPDAVAGTRIPDALWRQTLIDYPFLAQHPAPAQARLRQLSGMFLARKEFHGAQGLIITDAMAVAIAAQACLPVLHLGEGVAALAWYADFVGIVVHPDEVVAQREVMDEAGIVHRYNEVLAGEAMDHGPVMLSWQDVAKAGHSAEQGYNVVIHEFVHKLDLCDGLVDGCPPLPAGFMGTATARQARANWRDTLQSAYEHFREQVIQAERFGAASPWLDPYGAESLAEFFAVASEAYFVNRERFARDFDSLLALFDAFFKPDR
jgi:Mlc titration factor MtfA (ptsG expression regulator)